MRGKRFFALVFVVLLIAVVAFLAGKWFGKKSEPVLLQTGQPVITAPAATTATTTPGEQTAVTSASGEQATAASTTGEQTTAATQAQQTEANGTVDAADAIDAAKASAKASNPSLGELSVLASKVMDGWARVDMQPADRSTDAATWLLKLTDGKWDVVEYGTSVIQSEHPDAPAELFK